MNTFTKKHTSFIGRSLLGFIILLLALPEVAFAQAYVPVIDIKMDTRFPQYQNDFNQYVTDYFQRFDDQLGATKPDGTTDALRDLISGFNPNIAPLGASRDPDTNIWSCSKTGKTQGRAFAWNDPVAPWYMAWVAASTSPNPLPAQVPDMGIAPPSNNMSNKSVNVNDSGSLRCLLQDMVGWQKLQLFVQFHSLLKTYISDAQQKQLSNQLLNKINAANLKWAKEGVQVDQAGISTSEAVYVTNLNDSVYNRKQRTVSTVIDQASAPAGSPTGSLDLCDPLGTASQLAKNQRSTAEDPRSYTNSVTRCTLTAPSGPFAGGSVNDIRDYYINPNTTKGPGSLMMLGYSLNNPQDFELTAADVVEAETERRARLAEENYRQQLLGNGGIQPTQKCSGAADDPNCDPDLATSVSPAAQNSAVVTSAVQDNKAQIITANSLDSTVATSSQKATVVTNTEPDGLYGYDPTPMADAVPQVNTLVGEFYDAIYNGYFDIDLDKTDWGQAAMLNIYDSMSFSAQEPTSAIPTGGGDNTPVNTGY